MSAIRGERPTRGGGTSAPAWPFVAAIVLAVLLFAYETYSLSGKIGSDFFVFHDMVRRTLAGPADLYSDPRGIGEVARSLQGFLYPPPSFFLLFPFGAPPLGTGFTLLSWAAAASVALSLWMWAIMFAEARLATLSRLQWIALAGLALVTGPVMLNRLGQVDALILLFVSGGAFLATRGRPALGAAVLAFGTWVKIYPALLLLPLLLDARRRIPTAVGFAAGAILFPALSAVFFPPSVWRTFFVDMLPAMSRHVIVNIDNQSITAALARLDIPMRTALGTYDSVAAAPWIRIASPVVGLTLLLIPAILGRKDEGGRLVALASAAAVISLIAPLGWGHTYVYVLPLLMLMAASGLSSRSLVRPAVALVTWLSLLVPAYTKITALQGFAPLWHLFYARYAIATIVTLVAAWPIARAGGVNPRTPSSDS